MAMYIMNKMDANQEILSFLKNNQEEAYRHFASSLIPGGKQMYGVRIPLQRKIAKTIALGDWRDFLENAKDDSFEEVNIQGFVLAYAKGSFGDKEPYIRKFIEKIADWSVCDGFCATLKQVKEEQTVWWEFLWQCSYSDQEYIKRFALVMWLWYFNEEAYVEQIVDRITKIKLTGYYDKMAAAWCLAEVATKRGDLILQLLTKKSLDPFVHQKCIQKICESNKVSIEQKEQMKAHRLNKKFTKIL